jgi:hypothetical protein
MLNLYHLLLWKIKLMSNRIKYKVLDLKLLHIHMLIAMEFHHDFVIIIHFIYVLDISIIIQLYVFIIYRKL